MALEHLDKALADLAEKLAALGQQHGSEAIHLAGAVYQYAAIGDLLVPLLNIATAAILFWFGRPFVLRAASELRKAYSEMSELVVATNVIAASICALLFVADCVGGFVSAATAISPLTWAAAFNPNVALAAHILKAL